MRESFMKIPDLIDPIGNDGFRATGRPPFQVTALAATREEALARLREAIVRRMVEGSDDPSIPQGDQAL
jgi:hypothetical protein